MLEIPVQVNGKVRGKITVPANAEEPQVIEIARADRNVGKHLEGQNVKRAIYVRGRIVNFVIAQRASSEPVVLVEGARNAPRSAHVAPHRHQLLGIVRRRLSLHRLARALKPRGYAPRPPARTSIATRSSASRSSTRMSARPEHGNER